jgi:hypothetical protein
LNPALQETDGVAEQIEFGEVAANLIEAEGKMLVTPVHPKLA